MTRLRVTPGGRRGPDRLHVIRRDGTTVAWYDGDAGRISLLPEALGGVLRPADIEALYAAARGRRTWLRQAGADVRPGPVR
ncbi:MULTISPECIES: hypothetical protein [unclassified Streptomyces]|uniref:hypothetical protein n=1 Tax=unclassified Streptomyces TaxID=2593676 RepID=UPI002E2D7168|nr:hypothetical protein [Streptomyces sp. NBC_01429]